MKSLHFLAINRSVRLEAKHVKTDEKQLLKRDFAEPRTAPVSLGGLGKKVAKQLRVGWVFSLEGV